VDASGNVYVGGFSEATWGSPERAYTGYMDPFAGKLDASGALVWNTFLGGGGNERAYGIAVDASGNVYVGGYSDANRGNPEWYIESDRDAFAAKLGAPPPTTAELEITRARITRAGDKPGTLRVRGTAPGSAEEQIDASGGLTVTVSTGSGLTKVVEFAASDCRTWSRGARPGNIVCRQRLGGYDRPHLRLERLHSAREATGSYKLRYQAGGLSSDDTANLTGPITVTISEGDLDHTGEADTCVTTRKALRCE